MKPPTATTVFSTPKQRYQADAALVAAHQKMVDSDVCEHGLDTALAQLAYELADKAIDPNAAMGAGFQLRGAVLFSKKFKELAELPKPGVAVDDPGELRPPPDKRRP